MILAMTDIALAEENARLKARLAETEAALEDAVEAQRRLESIVGELRREKFGPRSEKLDPEQFNLPLEDVEVAQGILEAAQERARRALKGNSPAFARQRLIMKRGRIAQCGICLLSERDFDHVCHRLSKRNPGALWQTYS